MERITDEILLMVFGYLRTDDLRMLRLVSKRLKNVASDATLHKTIRFDRSLQGNTKMYQSRSMIL